MIKLVDAALLAFNIRYRYTVKREQLIWKILGYSFVKLTSSYDRSPLTRVPTDVNLVQTRKLM